MRCEKNTPEVDKDVMADFEASDHYRPGTRYETFFEHGQWFVSAPISGETWAVYDTRDGFGFES